MGSARCKHRVGKTCMIFVAVGAKLAHRAKHGDLAARGRGFPQYPERRRHGGGIGVIAFVDQDRKSTRSELPSLMRISYAVFCLKNKNELQQQYRKIQR